MRAALQGSPPPPQRNAIRVTEGQQPPLPPARGFAPLVLNRAFAPPAAEYAELKEQVVAMKKFLGMAETGTGERSGSKSGSKV